MQHVELPYTMAQEFWPVVAGLFVLGASACNAAGGDGSPLQGRSGSPGSDASGAQGGSSAGGSSGGSGGSLIVPDGSAGTTAADACAEQSYVGEQRPLDMYVMFDQSGSMGEAAGSSPRWTVIKSALESFIANPGAKDIGVGMQFFPKAVQTCTPTSPNCIPIPCFWCTPPEWVYISLVGGTCNPADYVVPEVPIGALPAQATLISGALAAHHPGGGTPTSAALAGAVEYATGWASAHPERKTIVVLATDGEPKECDQSIANIAAIAGKGLSASPPVQTFVIGVGKQLTALDAIAKGGGGSALIIDGSTADAGQQFLSAMNQIRAGALGCDFKVPKPAGGGVLDYSTLNVTYAAPNQGTAELVYKAKSPGECSEQLGGWYYDDAQKPELVKLCPKSCSAVTARAGTVSLKVGCTPSIEIPD